MPINKTDKSIRILQSRRYTIATNDSQEAFTRVLDLNASEIYINQNLIPTSNIPFSGSSQSGSIFVSASKNILKYYHNHNLSKSSIPSGSFTETWFFLDPTSSIAVPPGIVQSSQQTNFISNKYANPSLADNNAETVGSNTAYNVVVKINGTEQSINNYAFDYKMGVLQFYSNPPLTADAVTITAYQYLGDTLDQFVSSSGGGTGAGFPFSGSAVITGSLTVSGSGGITLVGGGTLIGTASWATNAITALFAPDYVPTSVTSSMLAPYVLNSQTSSFLLATQTSSLASLGVTGNATITGDLTVNGTTTYVNVNNLLVEDKFILLNSGSIGGVPNEGGIIIQTGTGSGGEAVGTAFYYDQEANRWVVNRSSSVAWNATSSVLSTSSDFIVTVTASAGIPTGSPVNFGTGDNTFSVGQMYIQTDGDNGIYIYA
jgi:hypothetical protein